MLREITTRALPAQFGLWLGLVVIALSPAANLLNFIYTPIIAVAALVLLLRWPMGYIGFVFWVWMLTPMIRRITDLASGYHEVSLVMVAPLVATLMGVLGLLRPHRSLPSTVLLPHFVILGVLFYGFLIGVKGAGLPAAAFALVNWAAPVLFGLYLLRSSGSAADKAKAMFDALTWGLLAIGLYGLYQFFYLPDWDAYWIRMSGLKSIGAPVPLMVRVFSTLNAPAILGFFAAASLLITITRPGKLNKVYLLPGTITFLLSLVRSAWGGLIVGLLTILWKATARRKAWYLSALVIAGLFVTPIVLVSQIGKVIEERTSSIADLSQDDSLAARLNIYQSFSGSSASAIFGVGLGGTGDVSSRLGSNSENGFATVLDSGLLEVVANFGVASLFLFASIGFLVVTIWRADDTHWVTATSTAAAIGSFSQLALANPFFGPAAMCFYPFVALSLLLGLERSSSISYVPTPQLSDGGGASVQVLQLGEALR